VKKSKKEIGTLQEILQFEPNAENKPSTALKLAKMIALESQDYQKVVELLEPYQDLPGKDKFYLMLELGLAYCNVNRNNPKSQDYKKGQILFEKVLNECDKECSSAVTDEKKLSAIMALASARLAWSNEPFTERRNKTSAQYYEALQKEPKNPYYLAESLGNRQSPDTKKDISPGNASFNQGSHRNLHATCPGRNRIATGTFHTGRLNLLIGEFETAYGFYARGIRHYLDKDQFRLRMPWKWKSRGST